MIRWSSLYFVLILLTATKDGRTQSSITTVLGASLNDIPALSASVHTPVALATDANGNTYVVVRGTDQVVRIDSGGTLYTFAGSGAPGSTGDGGPATAAGLTFPDALSVDSSGAVYIIDGSKIRRVGTNGIITTFAGTGVAGYSGDGGPALKATLNGPTAMAFDQYGNLFIADTGNDVIREVTTDGNIHTIAGVGYATSGGDGGPALAAGFNTPSGVAVDSSGNVYVSDTDNAEIRVISNGTIQRYAGQNSTSQNGLPIGGGNPNLALNATLTDPTVLAFDSAGNLYFVEPSANIVRQITPSGHIVTWAGTGISGGSGNGGWAWAANLDDPTGIAINSNNALLIADSGNNSVRIVTVINSPSIGNQPSTVINNFAGNGLVSFNPRGLALSGSMLYFSDGTSNRVRYINLSTGEVGLLAGNGVAAYAGDTSSTVTGTATLASLNEPRGVAVDSSGNVYIADSGNNRIRMVNTSGLISTVAGDGTGGYGGDGGPATDAEINNPYGVAVDTSGNLYIAEQTGQRVRKVNSSGTITTVAGTGTAGAPSSESGTAVDQPLYNPSGLAIESSGSLLIADTNNNRIRLLSTDGTITTVAGTGAPGDTGDGGPATMAQLNLPLGVGEDSNGNIYIADTTNNVIRWVGSDGNIGRIAGTGVAGYNGDGSPATAYELGSPSAVTPLTSGCSAVVADTTNERIRQVFPAVNYTITSTPSGLQVTLDGMTMTTPATIGLSPGTSYQLTAPSPQNGATGTRYISPAAQTISVSCGPAFETVNVAFQTQYSLTVTAGAGGTVTSVDPWQNAGASVTLNATPDSGYVFSGWTGACSGTGACVLVMNGPETVEANFVSASGQGSTVRRTGKVEVKAGR
jgi:trimeric autotransporter adhesin